MITTMVFISIVILTIILLVRMVGPQTTISRIKAGSDNNHRINKTIKINETMLKAFHNKTEFNSTVTRDENSNSFIVTTKGAK